jgi:hypothetical protein
MKTPNRKFITGIAITALLGAALWAMQAGADNDAASSLGSNWQCRKLPYIRICKQITHNTDKRPPVSWRAIET